MQIGQRGIEITVCDHPQLDLAAIALRAGMQPQRSAQAKLQCLQEWRNVGGFDVRVDRGSTGRPPLGMQVQTRMRHAQFKGARCLCQLNRTLRHQGRSGEQTASSTPGAVAPIRAAAAH